MDIECRQSTVRVESSSAAEYTKTVYYCQDPWLLYKETNAYVYLKYLLRV